MPLLSRDPLLLEMVPERGEPFHQFAGRVQGGWGSLSPSERDTAMGHLSRMQTGAARQQDVAVKARPLAPEVLQTRAKESKLAVARDMRRAALRRRDTLALKGRTPFGGTIASSVISRAPLLMELVGSGAVGGGPSPIRRPDLTGKRISGAPSNGMDTGKVGLRTKQGLPVLPGTVWGDTRVPVGGVEVGQKLARALRKRSIGEAATSGAGWVTGATPHSSVYSFDLADFDHVARLGEWRQKCPDINKVWHGAFCKRCDEQVWSLPVGGAEWSKRRGWAFENPLQGYPGWDSSLET